ncbi:MAG: aldehyde dehydrogenase family protein [Rhizobiaceae bacterium]
MTNTHAQWQKLADEFQPETRLLIGDSLYDSADGARFESINPATGDVVASIASATADDVERAAVLAESRFREGVWSRMPLRERMNILYRFADLIEENGDTFILLDTIEMGKPVSEMQSTDLPGAVLTFRFLAEAIDKVGGSTPNTNDGFHHYIVRQPLGVVGCITPWNYPLMMAAWKVAPALAAGNSVVLKPAEDSSLSSILLGQLFLVAGGPPGVFNVVPGTGQVAGQALARSQHIHKVSFTGSTGVGRLMYKYAADSNLKKVSAELGGKSPQIILKDVGDMERCATAVVDGIFGNQGEVCAAGSRILVANEVYEEFREAFVAASTKKYAPGDPLDPATTMGPLVNKAHQTRVRGYIDGAVGEGAKIVLGGDVDHQFDNSCYVSPTLFADVSPDMTIAREEIFGPVGALIRHEGIEQALSIANDSEFGLAAGIWTQNITNAHSLARDLQCGMVWINGYMNGDMTQPWGGWKQSGQGRDKCIDSLLENMQSKSVWVTL